MTEVELLEAAQLPKAFGECVSSFSQRGGGEEDAIGYHQGAPSSCSRGRVRVPGGLTGLRTLESEHVGVRISVGYGSPPGSSRRFPQELRSSVWRLGRSATPSEGGPLQQKMECERRGIPPGRARSPLHLPRSSFWILFNCPMSSEGGR